VIPASDARERRTSGDRAGRGVHPTQACLRHSTNGDASMRYRHLRQGRWPAAELLPTETTHRPRRPTVRATRTNAGDGGTARPAMLADATIDASRTYRKFRRKIRRMIRRTRPYRRELECCGLRRSAGSTRDDVQTPARVVGTPGLEPWSSRVAGWGAAGNRHHGGIDGHADESGIGHGIDLSSK
jgi:hypothetical protein